MSPHILTNTGRVLAEAMEWDGPHIEDLLAEYAGIADDRILDLAADVGALLIVSDDADLTSMSPWRGTPILLPRDFVAKLDGMRRRHRHRHRRRR